MKEEIVCPHCHSHFFIALPLPSQLNVHYCPFCRHTLSPGKATTVALESQKDASSLDALSVSFLSELLPEADKIQFSIGPYQIIRSIGKGGMGEVFLAYDTTCGRRLALKQIRPDLISHKQLHNRFIKEARITSQLMHPAIIPIYAIHSEADLIYYTMPYVEGETLKQLLRTARQNERQGKKLDHITESIPALIRIFLSICQAIAYAHSKNVLHRDIKPENIIVGQYGQIVILDWGLAKLIKDSKKILLDNDDTDPEGPENVLHHLTHVGKVVGTVAYMAPERAIGNPSNFQTDIYALGVILYQMLTLQQPFHRGTLKEYRKKIHLEKIVEPTEIAPYRDVPRSLSRVVMKCLAVEPELRYNMVDELIRDLENYIEGRSEWFHIAELNINNKNDWEFQENVLIAEHVALSHEAEFSDWVSLMISKASFQENIKIEASVRIGESGHGLGMLLSIPESAERQQLNDGYCLWLGSDISKTTRLLRSTVEVLEAPEIFLQREVWYKLRIEKIDNNIYFYLNDVLQFSYISHLPLAGTHIGLISRDADFMLNDFNVYIGSQNVTVNCLAVPNAFLAHKDYAVALNEYRRIGYSFPGRAEGREAMFRAGITLLEQANNTTDSTKKLQLFDLAQEEFHKLFNTPGAPLEYLGKALVYRSLGDYEEEAKCFELAYRRYPYHPLMPMLQEQILYRMHESSRSNRHATFNFILLALRYLPDVTSNPNTRKLLTSLQKHWEILPFIETEPAILDSQALKNLAFEIKLAFWLARPYVLTEIIDRFLNMQAASAILWGNALFALIELGSWKAAKDLLHKGIPLYVDMQASNVEIIKKMLDIAIKSHEESLESAVELFTQLDSLDFSFATLRTVIYLMERAIDTQQTEYVHKLALKIPIATLSLEAQLKIHACQIWAYLLEKNTEKASEILHLYPLELLSQESTILHFLYGCWLLMTEGKEIMHIHFSGIFEVAYPRTWVLFHYYLRNKLAEESQWFSRLFLWEKRQFYRQISLYYSCLSDSVKAVNYHRLAQQERIDIDEPV